MARTDQGNNLRDLVPQTGTVFTSTRRGLDTGSRRWKIDTDYAAAKAPKPGDSDSVFKTMYVDEVSFERMENNVTAITATYLGLIDAKRGKPDDIEESAGSEQVTTKPKGRQRFVQFLRPVPTVTVTYIRDKKESIMEAGLPLKPPVQYGDGTVRKGYEGDFVPDGEHLIYRGWILASRRVRVAGLGKKGSIYEMTDTYNFVTITSPEEL